MKGASEVRGYRVTGQVQGVGFRWWTQKTARGLGLDGTVRNVVDGSVEVRASGPTEALEELATRLERGPSSASVQRVTPFDVDAAAAAAWDGFQIVHS